MSSKRVSIVDDYYSNIACRSVNTAKISGALFAGLFALGTPGLAKDRPPEPIANPGECAVDAPIRVASVDSLRHFEGLIGHCPETILIESPAFKANRPRDTVRATTISEDADTVIEPHHKQETDAQFILAAKTKLSEDPKKSSDAPETATFKLGDGSIVAIVPPEAVDQPLDLSAMSEQAGEYGAEETIFALRPQSYGTRFDSLIDEAARKHRVDPLLLHAVITQESRYRDRAVSSAGARGLMQVMPGTGRDLGVSNAQHLFDPATNINAGAKLLSQLWNRLDGNLDLVLAAYNAGEGAVRKHGMRIPPYRETQDYVVKVKANYARLAGENGIAVNF